MKKLIQPIVKVLLVTVGLFACTSNFDDINKNEFVFDNTTAEYLFPGVVKHTLDLIGGDMNANAFVNYAHYSGGMMGDFPTFFFVSTTTDNWWSRWYVNVLKNIDEIKKIHKDDPTHVNRVAIANVWEAYVYSIMVSTYGHLPYSDALNVPDDVKDGIYNTFDSEEKVYTNILSSLDHNIRVMEENIGGDKLNNDPMYGGDNTKWIKFAQSLRLKIAMRIVEAFPELAREHIEASLMNEQLLIGDNSENAVLHFGVIEENWSPMYKKAVFENNIFQQPRINHHFMLFMKSYNDPRLQAFAKPAEVGFEFVDTLYSQALGEDVPVKYTLDYVGEPLARQYVLPEWDLNPNLNPLQGMDRDNYAEFNDEFMKMDMAFPLVTAAQVAFLKAEAVVRGFNATLSAREYYTQGIEFSFSQHNVGGVEAYLLQDGIAWNTDGTGDHHFSGIVNSDISKDPLEKIITQRWIADFNQGHDAWCLQKRTRVMTLSPHLQPHKNLGVFHLDYPDRLVYGSSERQLNGRAYQEMIAAQGEDGMLTPLKINKSKENVPDWSAFPASWSWEFAHAFYGSDVEDLEAAGVEYEILN
ncbi:SusD/RagB family nutrient-binding outer membrane lipoprotein [Persicobacter diffluens]|uniref:SusD/RagB family nutrient-binding outer membrane lipoprotein n=1 Tax=Persicobacter diffluens TaxID=981 RepID=A0AAN4W3V8_9BACT|nr:hypothetical protein PEDI_46170 [Persicobacter diffluens]